MRPGVDCTYDLRNGAIVLVPLRRFRRVVLPVEEPETDRVCFTCRERRPLYWFSRNGSKHLGRRNECDPCRYGWDPEWNVDEVLRLRDSGLVKVDR